jgi:imidazolonepropionase-like amidohydrolase
VHGFGARVAIHATTPETITSAIEAGIDSIEHGVGVTDAQIAAMAARGIALVPTLSILPQLPSVVLGMGPAPDAAAAMLAAVERHPEMVRRAAAAGVLVLAGTDAGMVPHGLIREEIGRLAAAGLPTADALAAGSWLARRYLGLPALAEGAPADLVAYPADPRHDLDVLKRPSLIMLAGRLVHPEADTDVRPRVASAA